MNMTAASHLCVLGCVVLECNFYIVNECDLYFKISW